MMFFFVLALLPLFAVADKPAPCYAACRFRFCGRGTTVPLMTPYVRQTRDICGADGSHSVGVVLETGEARLVFNSSTFVPISQFKRNELKEALDPHFFRSYKFVYSPVQGAQEVVRSGVGHMRWNNEQRRVLGAKCVVLPLRAWETVDGDVTVTGRRESVDELDCVAFSTTTWYKYW